MTHRFDELSTGRMRAGGTWKWSTPGTWRGRDWIGAFVAEMDYPVADAVAGAVRDDAAASRFGYLADAWTADMAAACADFWADRLGWSFDPGRVRAVPDLHVALAEVIRHFTPAGSAVVVPTPAYMPFLRVPGLVGREVVEVPMIDDDGAGWRLDVEGIDAALAAGGGIVLLVNPHNPTGRVHAAAELEALAAVVAARGARVFADEIHAPLTYPGHVHRPYAASSAAAAEQAITATSASKAWNIPGLKCAQVILSGEADVETWAARGYLAEHGTTTTGVRASAAAYRDSRAWLDDVLGYLDGNRALLAEADLPGLVATVPEGTYLAWLDGRALGLESPAQFLRDEAGVVLTDGALCGAAGRGFLRMTLATSRPVLAEALERMGRALALRARA